MGFPAILASFKRGVCIFESRSIWIFAEQASVGICGRSSARQREIETPSVNHISRVIHPYETCNTDWALLNKPNFGHQILEDTRELLRLGAFCYANSLK